MSGDFPEIGKISPEIFSRLIFPRLGAPSKNILVGPEHGVDVGVVRIGDGQVMAFTSDPVFIVPAYGFTRAAWFAVHILASDAATSGLPPTYLAIDLNLPLSMTEEELSEMWQTIHSECEKMGIAIISGHTARYEGCNYPMVGGAVMISVGPEENYVTPKFARPGDQVIVTKGAAVEAAGLFAASFPERIEEEFGADFRKEAEAIFWQMSVVEDAMTAVSVGVGRPDSATGGGVTAMHDATECGVLGGLYEVAEASRVGMRIEKDAIIVQEPIRRICNYYGIDPYSSISEGTLIITVIPQKTDAVLDALRRAGIKASRVGEITPREQGMVVVEDGSEKPMIHPKVDPFWEAFGRAMAEKSN